CVQKSSHFTAVALFYLLGKAPTLPTPEQFHPGRLPILHSSCFSSDNRVAIAARHHIFMCSYF
ncbi:MAG: hypothetical protein KDE58_05650, partial [Caldilineaceae bacterium]|nr:hypothetical protein [Caldilineaceae bacterium]